MERTVNWNVCVCVCVCMCVCVYVCMYVCTYVCMCVALNRNEWCVMIYSFYELRDSLNKSIKLIRMYWSGVGNAVAPNSTKWIAVAVRIC